MKKCKKKLGTSEPTIDLHGYTVQEAHDQCKRELQCYCRLGCKRVKVITGKSGQIRKEFEFWIEQFKFRILSSDVGSFIIGF